MADKKKKDENIEEVENTETATEETVETVDKKLLDEAIAQSNEYKDKWMRSVAEFDNYKKRNARIWQDAFDEGLTVAILKILPIGDNLEMALTMGLDDKTKAGIELLIKKFNETLKGMEIEEINPINEKFDPQVAEAIMQVEGEESDIVKQVFQKGYKCKDKIIRYAKVSVTK